MYKMFIGPTSSEIEIPWIRIVGKLCFVLLLFQTLSLAQSLDSIFVHVQGQVYVHGLDLEEDSTHSSEIPVYVSEKVIIDNWEIVLHQLQLLGLDLLNQLLKEAELLMM